MKAPQAFNTTQKGYTFVFSAPKPKETKTMGFRDSIKLKAYQETIDAFKKTY